MMYHMAGGTPDQLNAQLDSAEREHLEHVVTQLRDRVEDNVRFQLTQHGLDTEPADTDALDEDTSSLAEAIELEAVDDESWADAFAQYITGVGYTIVNRLAALRCMEVRGFVAEEVTVFKANGLTPAAETLVYEEFLLADEAILQAYHDACDRLAEEIEILFDRSSAYSLIDPDDDTFEELCGMLDSVPNEVWRADDVLGWIYEYYNRPVVESLDAKNTLNPGDVGPANQFYTPHWVVRMLTDNSLGKLYLEATGQESTVPEPAALTPEDRKNRVVTPADSPTVSALCTYLIPDEEPGDAPAFDHPSELRVIDPACGSGHFLLYAFDVLERIWWAETDLDRAEIPAKVLEHNLYGVDIDLRSCQLSAFNLYLKARTRTENEDGHFEMPTVDIVCADARVAEIEEATKVLDDITGEGSDLREALAEIIDTFQQTNALGSLLDVSGTLEGVFESGQTGLSDWSDGTHQSLNSFFKALREAVAERTSESFGEQNLRSFLSLLIVLTQKYDVSLMNPPYGSGGRMPDDVQAYVTDHYEYMTEYYVNFFEACDRLTRNAGRVGMLVPRSFLFNQTLEPFRADFIGPSGSFDFLAEFGYGILDNATVGTAGTIVRSGSGQETLGNFIRLHDVEKGQKERVYLDTLFEREQPSDVTRFFEIPVAQFNDIPGRSLCYSLPPAIRHLHTTERKLGREHSDTAIADVKQGLASGNNDRFLRKHWEAPAEEFPPFTNAGGDVWVLPAVDEVIDWTDRGRRIKRYAGARFQNTQYYRREGLTWAYIKRTGRRFGYYPGGGLFGHASNMVFSEETSLWTLLAALNSDIYHGLMLCLTPERKWEAGYVGKLPWFRDIETNCNVDTKVQKQHNLFIKQRVFDVRSPYYIGPALLPPSAAAGFFYDHHHQQSASIDPNVLFDTGCPEDSLLERCRNAISAARADRICIEALAEDIDQSIAEALSISEQTREQLKQEIWLRTVEQPEDRRTPDPADVPNTPDDFPEMVKALLHHLTLRIVTESDDGIVPISSTHTKPPLFDRLEDEFNTVFGEHASDRLREADAALGTRSAADEAYPNLRTWLENDLFEYHVQAFDRVPILWRVTTKRLVPDPEGEGFACLVDYHQLDSGLFDRLQRYLEPRKALLREKRSASNRRHSDDSLSATEKAAAEAEYDRCESGLEQIAAFEDRLVELAQPNPRTWSTESRHLATEAADLVADFREQVADRLSQLDALAAMDDVDMETRFTPTFYSTIEDNREEWLDALADLEAAFDAYAREGSEPVEAHLYDLFIYYHDLVGTTHFASNGILFMNYYFRRFDDVGQAQIGSGGISERERLLFELARGLDAYESLAEAIGDACDELAGDIATNWADRARSEITTAGYRPNLKHGVAINITPLAAAEIVPKTVDDTVL